MLLYIRLAKKSRIIYNIFIMSFICTVCGKLHEDDSVNPPETTEYTDGNICRHNWIKERGFSNESPTIGGIIELEAELVENVKKEETPNTVSEYRKKASDLQTSIDMSNDINRDLEKMYAEIKKEVGLNVELPEFRQVVTSLAFYDDKASNYLRLLTSKIADRAHTLANAKMAIGVENILSKLQEVLLEKINDITDDEVGDNNLKFVLLGSKAISEYQNILDKIKESNVVPEADRKLTEMKKEEKEKQTRVKLTQADIQKFLQEINEEEIKKTTQQIEEESQLDLRDLDH